VSVLLIICFENGTVFCVPTARSLRGRAGLTGLSGLCFGVVPGDSRRRCYCEESDDVAVGFP
jgi:hypothetical protein